MSKTFYQITTDEKYTIRNKTDKNWKKTWNNVLFLGVKILLIVLGHKKQK